MDAEILRFDEPVTLVGGGVLDRAMLDQARSHAPVLVAADRGADRLDEWGFSPRAVIGDMDSLSDPVAWRGRTHMVHLTEQETTDFEKCLYSVSTPYFVAIGFTGRRTDHTLAVLHSLLHRPGPPVFLLGEVEAMALLPPGREVALQVGAGATVSLFPLLPGRGLASHGLQWPIDGLDLEAGRQIGTSNRANADEICVTVEGEGILLMVPRAALDSLIASIAGV